MTNVRGQTYPIYWLKGKYESSDFRGTTNPIITLKCLEAMTMFTMINQEKVKYTTCLLKKDVKVW